MLCIRALLEQRATPDLFAFCENADCVPEFETVCEICSVTDSFLIRTMACMLIARPFRQACVMSIVLHYSVCRSACSLEPVRLLFGAFEIKYFRESDFWFIAVPLFILFMLLVPTVMLNALIAIMSDTFARVQQHQVAAGRLEFAKIILELEEQTSSAYDRWREEQMYVPDDAHEGDSCFLHVLAPLRKSASNRQARSQRIFRELEGVQDSIQHVADDVSMLDNSVDVLMGESGLNVDAVGGNS